MSEPVIWLCVIGLLALLVLIGVVLRRAQPKKPRQSKPVWHEMPPLRGDGTTPCCGVRPQTLPLQDRLSSNPRQVTCGVPDSDFGHSTTRRHPQEDL